jgi:hypothetical protein
MPLERELIKMETAFCNGTLFQGCQIFLGSKIPKWKKYTK